MGQVPSSQKLSAQSYPTSIAVDQGSGFNLQVGTWVVFHPHLVRLAIVYLSVLTNTSLPKKQQLKDGSTDVSSATMSW
jgi:hypothetical protein